eukprot:bmy_13417T0
MSKHFHPRSQRQGTWGAECLQARRHRWASRSFRDVLIFLLQFLADTESTQSRMLFLTSAGSSRVSHPGTHACTPAPRQGLGVFKRAILEKAQIYPREHERMQRSWQQLPPLHVCSLKGLQGAMKEKSMRQSGEPRAGCRVHPGVRVGKLTLPLKPNHCGSRGTGTAGWWWALLRTARRYPWPTNVLLYTALFSAGDALQQRLRGGPADWRQTGRVATVAVAFHVNFNYVWLRLLEHARRPGQGAVRPGARRAGVRLCLLLRYEYSLAKG